jgi:hypothetical protein
MLRALVLLAAIVFFRTFLPGKPRYSPTQTTPYINSLDGLLSAEQLSSALEEVSRFEACAAAAEQTPCCR